LVRMAPDTQGGMSCLNHSGGDQLTTLKGLERKRNRQ
jgi:hypothetical protein